MKVVATAAIGLGFVLLLMSAVWTSLFRAESQWSDEKAQRSVDVKARLAWLGAKVNGQPGGKVPPASAKLREEFEALEKENDELNTQFQSVHDSPNSVARLFKYSGIIVA